MASGVELATAYVSLVAETSKLKKDINAAFDEAGKSSARASKKIGENLSAGLGGTKNSAAKAGADAAREYERALKSSLRGEKIGRMIGEPIGKGIGLAIKGGIGLAAVGATAAVGTLVASLSKGFTRLKNIDNAKFKLEALGNSAADVKKIMDAAQKSVKGTAFGLDAAAGTAATAVAAGVAPGTDLSAYLTNVADAAAIAQTSMEEMGSIFNKVQTNGKAMTDDLQMLADRGLPIFTWLQKQYGVTGEALQKMVEDGKVSSADFNRAISSNISGAAQKMGQSFEGAMQNLDAALGRLGASLLGIPFNEASGGIGSITEALDKLNAWVVENQDMMIDFWASFGKGAISGAQDVLKTVSSMLLAFGQLQNAVGDILGGIMKAGATVDQFFGRDEKAKEQFAMAEEFFAWGNSAAKASDDVNALIAGLDGNKASIDQWAERAKNAAQLTKALGDAVATVDDNQILIKDNTPEVNKQLDDLGVKLETLPSGDVKLVPNTPEAQQIIDAFLGANNPTPPVPVPVEPGIAAADQVMNDFVARWSAAIITPSIAPGSGVPGTNPLDVFGGGGGGGRPTNPLDVFAGGGGGGPGGPVGNMPSGLVTGGKQGADGLFPNAEALKQRYASWGFSNIGGYSANVDQPWDEHQTGTAIDVPIPGGNGGAGISVVQDALRQPGAKYAIWQQKMWYPDGRVVPMPDRGSPTENHMDHVHVRTYADGGAARGPGGPKSDKVPAMLSNGEHVWTAAEVAAVGGQGAMYQLRAMAAKGMIPGFNSGGAVDSELLDLLTGRGGQPRTTAASAFGDLTRANTGNGMSYLDDTSQFNPNMLIDTSTTSLSSVGQWPGYDKQSWNMRDLKNVVTQKPVDVYNRTQQQRRDLRQNDELWKFFAGEGDLYSASFFANGGAVKLYDNGGLWPTDTLGLNTTGKDEYVLTPEEIEKLKQQGIDPATVQHGMGQGALPGPPPAGMTATPDQLNGQPQGGDGAELMGGSRTEGYIPAGAGSTAVAGESFMSGLYSMGAEVINGIIDQAASMASSAAGMAATVVAPGSGGAAAGAAQAGIGMATSAAKRGVEYGAQMLGIGTDALIEQLTPFGAPRLLTTDPTGFMPQQALMDAATTSLEKAFQPQQPQGPEQPEQVPAGGVTSQTAEMEPGGAGGPQFNTTVNATVKDVNELNRTLNDQQRLNMLQHSGRP